MSHSKHKYRSYLLSAFFLLLGSNGIASEPKKFGNESDFSGNNITQVIEDKVSDQQSQKKGGVPAIFNEEESPAEKLEKGKEKAESSEHSENLSSEERPNHFTDLMPPEVKERVFMFLASGGHDTLKTHLKSYLGQDPAFDKIRQNKNFL